MTSNDLVGESAILKIADLAPAGAKTTKTIDILFSNKVVGKIQIET